MLWLISALLAQFFFAAVSFGDKVLLTARSLGRPATYAVAVGGLNILLFLGVPFFGAPVLAVRPALLGILAGAIFVLALWPYYHGIARFEVSRIVPVVGALVPILALAVSWLIFRSAFDLNPASLLAFFLLTAGSVFLTREKGKGISWPSLRIALLASPLFAVSLILQRLAYLEQSFWSGLVWGAVGMSSAALAILIFSPLVRLDLVSMLRPGKNRTHSLRVSFAFLGVQASGVLAGLLQNAAVYLVPPGEVAFVNALQGVQYVILFFFVTAYSAWSSRAGIGEDLSLRVLIQKGLAILAIVFGLVLLVLTGGF